MGDLRDVVNDEMQKTITQALGGTEFLFRSFQCFSSMIQIDKFQHFLVRVFFAFDTFFKSESNFLLSTTHSSPPWWSTGHIDKHGLSPPVARFRVALKRS